MLTHRRDGSPQMSPIVCNVDADGSHRRQHARDRDEDEEPAARPARVAVRASDGFFGDWIQVDGHRRGRVAARRDGAAGRLLPLDAGEHPDWDDYRAAMVRDQRVIVRITPERAGPDRAG